MSHTCFGEYCTLTGSWDCLNRSDREEADKRTQEEVENARLPIRVLLKISAEDFSKKMKEILEASISGKE